MTYTCINDRYCADADTFDSIEEFQAMCLSCFGERAQLTDHGDTVTDETGAIVLRRMSDTSPMELVIDAALSLPDIWARYDALERLSDWLRASITGNYTRDTQTLIDWGRVRGMMEATMRFRPVLCGCGCGEVLHPTKRYHSSACRVRAHRAR